MRKSARFASSVISLAVLSALSTSVFAADAPNEFAFDSLTWNGVTFYGTVDAAYTHQTHGLPYDDDNSAGTAYLISKGSKDSFSGWTNNGLSQSAIGLKGDIPLNDDISGVFKLDIGFNPLSLQLADGPKSLISNGSDPKVARSANGDSGRAGQVFNGAAFAGVNSKTWGLLTFGRQTSLLADDVVKYDPNAGANALSLLGGAVQGGGATQNARLDNSLKYFKQFGSIRVGAQYQFSGHQYALFESDGTSKSATQLQLGGDYGNFSADLVYAQKRQAISASASSTKYDVDSLKGTAFDNTAIALTGSYKLGDAKLFGGYEEIVYKNPSSPITAGSHYLGDYLLSTVANTAYNNHKRLDVGWLGLKYTVNPRLDVSAAYYAYRQNSYATTNCSNASNAACSGAEDVYSLSAVYKLVKHVDLYAGVLRSKVRNGLANGYVSLNGNSAETTSYVVGTRASF